MADNESILTRVRHIERVSPDMQYGDRSSEVNDYFAIDGWILLNTGTSAGHGDSGPYSDVYYVLGWIGEGKPQFPPAHPFRPY